MKAPRILSYLLVAAAAAAGGYFLPHPARQAAADGKSRTPATSATQAVAAGHTTGTLPDSIAAIIGDEPITAGNANAITYRALEEASPVSRMASVGLLLESMTPSNALGIYEAFLDITKKSGRRHDGEWALMLKRYGEVMGAACFQQLLPEKDKQNLALAMEGWAAVNPDEALKALKDAGLKDPKLDTAWLTGVCRKDPEKALTMALKGDYTGIDGAALITQSIHTAGLDGTREALQKALDESPDAAASEVFKGLFASLADTIIHKNFTDDKPGLSLDWIEQQKDQPYISAKVIDEAAYGAFLKGDPTETINWIGRMNAAGDGDMGSTGLYRATVANPALVAKLDEPAFDRYVQALPKSGPVLRALAVIVGSQNPARAAKLRAAVPTEAAVQP